MRVPVPFLSVLGAALSFLTFTSAAAAQVAIDPYEDAFARSAAFSAAGQSEEAARALELILQLYPQDYALPLQIAWIHLQAGRLAEAERFYRVALERSPTGAEAREGLARVLEAEAPKPQSQKPSWQVSMTLSGEGSYFPDHAVKQYAAGGMFAATFAHESGFFFGGAYRYGHFSPTATSGADAWDQHEGYATIGWGNAMGGIAAHYGIVYDWSGVLGLSHHIGFTARVSPFGDIELRGSASLYDDMKVYRLEPSWRIPLVGGLSLRPGAAFQYAGGDFHATGMATLSFDHSAFGLWAGGKYGDEVRPVYFGVPVIYDVQEKIAYGAWAGASVNVSDIARIHMTYAMDRMKQDDTSPAVTSTAHSMSVGVTFMF